MITSCAKRRWRTPLAPPRARGGGAATYITTPASTKCSDLTHSSLITVALDVSPLRKPGADRGLGRYIREVREFFDRNPTYTPRLIDIVVSRPSRLSEFLEIPPRLARVRASNADIYHSMTPYHIVPTVLTRSVVSVQDIITLEARSHDSTGIKARFFYKLARRARCLLTNTDYTFSRIVNYLGVNPAVVVAAPLPVAAAFRNWTHERCLLPSTLQGRDYVVGIADTRAPDPRKRIPWLLGAFRRLCREGLTCVVVGSGSETIPEPIIGLGYIDDTVLADVFFHARALVFPSAYEGQGMPPLEAMTVGTPVVAFRNSSLLEVIGVGGVLLEDHGTPAEATAEPHSENDAAVGEIVDAVFRVLGDADLHHNLSRAARAQAASYTTERFDTGLRAAYDRALAKR